MTPRSTAHRAMLLLLLGSGAVLWGWVERGHLVPVKQLAAVAVLLVLSIAPAASPRLRRRLGRFARAGRHRRAWVGLIIFAAASIYLAGTAMEQHRDRFPKVHDEFTYLIQARQMARGRLWEPPHPLADFFESEYLFTRPVYAGQYWPGAPLVYVPGIWAGVSPCVTSIELAAAAATFLFLVVTEVTSLSAGCLAALLLITIEQFRDASFSVNSHLPELVTTLAATAGWLRWRRTGTLPSALLVGVATGWAMITRPLDAACILLPLTASIVIDWPKPQHFRRGLLLIAGSALPFLVLQLAFDQGVTGHLLSSPFGDYARRNLPQVTLGFPRYDPSLRPVSRLLQIQLMDSQKIAPAVRAHQWPAALRDWWRFRIPLWLETAIPAPLLLILLPAGLLEVTSLRRWVLVLPIPLFFVAYGCYTLSLPDYSLAIVVGLIVLVVLGLRAIGRAWPGRVTALLLPAGVIGLCVARLPELSRVPDGHGPSPAVAAAVSLPLYIHQPGVVLFRFHPWNDVQDEPVYNADVAWPDDAPIIRAHDLGPERNQQLFRYYAQRQPWRVFYRYDQGTGLLSQLQPAVGLLPSTTFPE